MWQATGSSLIRVTVYLLTASQIHQVELPAELLLRLRVFLLHVDEEDAVAPGAVLVHVWETHITHGA